MAVEILTRQDLNDFRALLLDDIRQIFQNNAEQPKQWLKSSEVRKLLNISPGTLQTLRNNKTLSYTKIGGIIYYPFKDIEKILDQNKVSSERTLFNTK